MHLVLTFQHRTQQTRGYKTGQSRRRIQRQKDTQSRYTHIFLFFFVDRMEQMTQDKQGSKGARDQGSKEAMGARE